MLRTVKSIWLHYYRIWDWSSFIKVFLQYAFQILELPQPSFGFWQSFNLILELV